MLKHPRIRTRAVTLFTLRLFCFFRQLTPTEKHRSKNDGDRKNEQFHNSVFLFDIFICRSIADPLARILHE